LLNLYRLFNFVGRFQNYRGGKIAQVEKQKAKGPWILLLLFRIRITLRKKAKLFATQGLHPILASVRNLVTGRAV